VLMVGLTVHLTQDCESRFGIPASSWEISSEWPRTIVLPEDVTALSAG
jgi:hypothetical protein